MTLAIKALAGGGFVCLFALIGELLRPKQFAGLFSAAPSVALASLLVTLWLSGPGDLAAYLFGMAAGAVAFVAYALTAAPAIRRFGALIGSGVSAATWFGVAAALHWLVLG